MGTQPSKFGQAPSRPGTDPRGPILLDVVDGTEEAFDVSFLVRCDHPVMVCHGPESGSICPLVADDVCEKYAQAHGIVFELDLDDAQHQAILATYRQKNPDIPIRVVASDEQAQRYGRLLAGVEIWPRVPSVADLDGFAAEVEAADRDIG